MFRIGTVNIDTSHAPSFAEILQKGDVARYTCVYNDGFRTDEEVDAFITRFGLEKRYTSLEEMAGNVDIAFIQGCDWDRHLALAEPFVKAAHSDILLALLRLAREENIDEMLATAYMSVAVGRLLSAVRLTERGTAVETDDLRRVLGYIAAHIDEKITLDTLSSSLYINRYSISRLFSERMGCGLNEYVNTLRADRARSLLRDTSMPLSEVCRRSGFESERTFYRVFREQYGASPRQYGRSTAAADSADKR